MLIKLVAFEIDLYYAWQKHFHGCDDVIIIDGDILTEQADALISPANSFGYMDGGLDLKISQAFGWELETKVREQIIQEHYGELPVGNALIIETDLLQFPYLISAPTMRVPMNVAQTTNAFLAFRAAIIATQRFNAHTHRIHSIACPGLGTGEGQMTAEQCAIQMREAYDICLSGKRLLHGGLAAAVRNHQKLLNT